MCHASSGHWEGQAAPQPALVPCGSWFPGTAELQPLPQPLTLSRAHAQVTLALPSLSSAGTQFTAASRHPVHLPQGGKLPPLSLPPWSFRSPSCNTPGTMKEPLEWEYLYLTCKAPVAGASMALPDPGGWGTSLSQQRVPSAGGNRDILILAQKQLVTWRAGRGVRVKAKEKVRTRQRRPWESSGLCLGPVCPLGPRGAITHHGQAQQQHQCPPRAIPRGKREISPRHSDGDVPAGVLVTGFVSWDLQGLT